MTILATIAAIILVAACVLTMASNVWNIAEALTSGMTPKATKGEKDSRHTYSNWEKAYSAR